MGLAQVLEGHPLPYLCATTGLSESTRSRILGLGTAAPTMIAPNTSLGVAVLRRLVQVSTRLLTGHAIHISEAHHVHKRDRPSGTALALARAVTEAGGPAIPAEGIEVERSGETVGTHEVRFEGVADTLSIRHEAKDRRLFAAGALTLAAWLAGRGPGAWTVDDWLADRCPDGPASPHG